MQVYIGTICIVAIYLFTQYFPAVSTGQVDAGQIEAEQVVKEDKKVAITFDDGPNAQYTEILLDGLKERNVKATFFLIGKQAEQNPEIVERMQREGHEIGNHTYDHVNLCSLSVSEVKEQVDLTNEAIMEITGEYPIYIRPPFGCWSDELGDETGMIDVMWNVDPRDWETDSVGTIIQRVLNNVEDRDIILFHDCSKSSVDAALAVVDALRERGYEFVGVDEILFD